MPLDFVDDTQNPDLLAQQDALAQRRDLLKQQAARAAAQLGIYAPGGGVDIPQPEGFQSAVTGAKFIAPMTRRPLLADLTPLIADTSLANERSSLAADQSRYNRAEQADALQRMQQMPQTIPGGAPLQGPTPDGSQLRTVAQPPSLRDTLTWAAGLQNNPRTAGVGADIIKNQLVTLPQKSAEQVLEYLKLAETRRHNTADEGKPIPVPQVGLFQPDGQGHYSLVQDTQPQPKPLPEEAMKAWRANNVTMGQLNDAVAAFDTPQGAGATGFWPGLANALLPAGSGEAVTNFFDPSGKATRALVTQVGALKVHDITGAAYGVKELDRLNQFLPTLGDDADTVRTKLRGLQSETQKMQNEIVNQASDQNYKPPTNRVQPQAPANNSTSTPQGTARISDTNRERLLKGDGANDQQNTLLQEYNKPGNTLQDNLGIGRELKRAGYDVSRLPAPKDDARTGTPAPARTVKWGDLK